MTTPALFTDLYRLTMAQAYEAEHMDQRAVFELTFRKMPENRNYIVAAGIADVLEFLANFRFSREELDYLRKRTEFSDVFRRRIEGLRFTGDVYAIPEGTPVFPNGPLVQVIAPILEAQLMETLVLNQVHFQSLAAAKAVRVVEAAKGRSVVDFSSRRAHGTDAALKVARATYLAGGEGTSNVLAGLMYGIPVFGTMAHSYVQVHDSEAASFAAFAALYPSWKVTVSIPKRRTAIVESRTKDAFAVWVTGLPASGKSTLVTSLKAQLADRGIDVAVLQSDVLRHVARFHGSSRCMWTPHWRPASQETRRESIIRLARRQHTQCRASTQPTSRLRNRTSWCAAIKRCRKLRPGV